MCTISDSDRFYCVPDHFYGWVSADFRILRHDFSLMDGVGEGNPNIIGAGESVTFLMTISGACAGTTSCTMSDFVVAQGSGYTAAAKFVNGPENPEAPGMEDSAFAAAVVPEPTSAVLIGIGLTFLGARRRS